MQWPIICDLTKSNHCTPFILPRFRGVITKNSRNNSETSHRERDTPDKRHTTILLVNVWPIITRINYNVKARGKTIGALHRLVFYSESVSPTDRIIHLVWRKLWGNSIPDFWLELSGILQTVWNPARHYRLFELKALCNIHINCVVN